MLIHYKYFANTGLNAKYYTLEIVDDFPLAIWHLLDTFENDDESEDSSDLSDLCDGSKLTVELYYTDLNWPTGDEGIYFFNYTYIFYISELKSQINVDNPDECELALAIAQAIKGYFENDRNLYKPYLDGPKFGLAKVCMTLALKRVDDYPKSI